MSAGAMPQALSSREVVTGGLAALPPVNSRVSVCPVDATGTSAYGQVVEVPSRVEDLHLNVGDRKRPSSAELVVAQPVFAGDATAQEVGTPFLLRWLTDRGVHEVTARYLGRRRVGPALVAWRLGVRGPVTRVQRRAHARVAVAVPACVVLRGAPAGDPAGDGGDAAAPPVTQWAAVTVDLSEGGVLVALRLPPHDGHEGHDGRGADGALPPPGADVEVRFELAGEAFALAGRVVRQQPPAAVAVAFDDPNAHGDRLRPLLFARQLNARRVGVA